MQAPEPIVMRACPVVSVEAVVPAATMGRAWRMRQDSRSPSYTTELADVPVVRA